MENQPKIQPTSVQNPSIIHQKIHPKSIKFQLKSKNVTHFVLGAILEASWRRLGRVLEANITPSWCPKPKEKSIKHRCNNRSKNGCLPSFNFDACLIDFCKENGSILAPRSDQKSMPTSKGRFKKQ